MKIDEIKKQLLDRFGFTEDGVDAENQLKIFSFMDWYKSNIEIKPTDEEIEAWISVRDKLPEEYKFSMSEDVLTIAGSKMSVKCFDYELNRWTGSAYITVTHWMPLPKRPAKGYSVKWIKSS